MSVHNLRDWHTLSIQRIVSVSTSGNGRNGEWATQWYTWWGEAPEETENINEGADVGKFRRCARPIRVPSLGSLVSLVSRFSRNGVDCLQNAPSLRSRDRPRLGERIGTANSLGPKQTQQFRQNHRAVPEPRPTRSLAHSPLRSFFSLRLCVFA
jgi:hypothetical protein